MVSVIVPIFNREKFIKRCVDSIVNQTYSDIEIILIDDGSTDESGRICDEYATIDSRVKVLHQTNKGSSISRIRGIERSQGDYILFVDSDDWIEPDMVECLLEKALSECLDIVWCDFKYYTPKTIIYRTPFVNNPTVMLNAIYDSKVLGVLWNKLYRVEMLRNLKMADTDYMEDMFYSTQILAKNPSMSYIPQALYHYDKTTPDALTKNKDFLVKCIIIYEQCYKYLESQNSLNLYEYSLLKRILRYKFLLLKEGRYVEAQSILPFAHLKIQNYPISFPVSIIYWIGFNGSVIGRYFLSIYMNLWGNRKNLTSFL